MMNALACVEIHISDSDRK